MGATAGTSRARRHRTSERAPQDPQAHSVTASIHAPRASTPSTPARERYKILLNLGCIPIKWNTLAIHMKYIRNTLQYMQNTLLLLVFDILYDFVLYSKCLC